MSLELEVRNIHKTFQLLKKMLPLLPLIQFDQKLDG